MIQSNYKILFSIQAFHTYFEKNICSCFKFNPDDDTLNLMKRFGFSMRPNVNGFDFFSNVTNSISETLNYITSVTGLSCFNFQVTTNNYEFNSFTDLPTGWVGQFLFDSESALNKYQNGIVSLATNLTPEQYGSCIGNLTLHFEDILSYQNENGSTSFQINFNARATQWNYYVINESAMQLNNPSITGKLPIDFEGPEQVTIQSGQTALMFSSGNNLIPMSEVPKYIFDLVNNPKPTNGQETTNKKSAGKVVFKGLPNPNPKYIGHTTINEKDQISSPMYVYI